MACLYSGKIALFSLECVRKIGLFRLQNRQEISLEISEIFFLHLSRFLRYSKAFVGVPTGSTPLPMTWCARGEVGETPAQATRAARYSAGIAP